MIDTIVTALVAVIAVLGPLAIVAYLALAFGADSRPGIEDDDRRPWLVPSA